MLRARNVYFAGTALIATAAATESTVGAMVVAGVSLLVYALAAGLREIGI